MTDLSRLYENMTQVCREASMADLETMLRAIGGALEGRHNKAMAHVYIAARELQEYRLSKRAPRKSGPNILIAGAEGSGLEQLPPPHGDNAHPA